MRKYISYGYVILGAACWGLIGLFNRMLGEAGLSMGNTVAIRNIGSVLLMSIVFLVGNRSVFHIELKHLPIFLGSGFIGVFGLGWTYFSCQMLCSLAVAGTLLYLAPSFVVLASAVLWKEPFTKRKAMALLMALCGCALVSGIAGGNLHASLIGLLLGIGAGISYASYTVFAHYGLQHYSSYSMIYWTFVVAGIASLSRIDIPELIHVLAIPRGVLGALGLVIIGTVLPYLFYTKGLERVESGLAAVLANVEPVVAALSGMVLFHEKLSMFMILGIGLVLGAAALLASGEKTLDETNRN